MPGCLPHIYTLQCCVVIHSSSKGTLHSTIYETENNLQIITQILKPVWLCDHGPASRVIPATILSSSLLSGTVTNLLPVSELAGWVFTSAFRYFWPFSVDRSFLGDKPKFLKFVNPLSAVKCIKTSVFAVCGILWSDDLLHLPGKRDIVWFFNLANQWIKDKWDVRKVYWWISYLLIDILSYVCLSSFWFFSCCYLLFCISNRL